MRVKVCGITNLEDALFSIDMGAWALGFNFYLGSPRYISLLEVEKIINRLPKEILTVGVFVNETQENISIIRKTTDIQMIQLHGDETHEFCKKIQQPVIKAIRPSTQNDIKRLSEYTDMYAILVDAKTNEQFGGTGKCADWLLAKQIAMKYPTILAGGLNSENVAAAISAVNPFAIDVCSGVELTPGRKSREKLTKFFNELNIA